MKAAWKHYTPQSLCMKLNDMDPDLQKCIYQFSMGHGRLLMEEICIENGYDERYKVIAWAQDSIGWQ